MAIDIIVKDTSNEGFAPLEAGAYRAVCYAIVNMGTTWNDYYKHEQTKIMFCWELPDERITVDGEDKPRALSQTYTLSLNEKSGLRKMLEGWRGRAFTPEELQGFSLSKVLGAPCLISTVIRTGNNGRDYANVASVSRLPKGMEVPKTVENPKVIFDITNEECPLSEMSKLPEWIQKRIFESAEYKARTASDNDDYVVVDNEEDLPF